METRPDEQLSLLDEDTEARILANAQQRLLHKQQCLMIGSGVQQTPLKDLFGEVTAAAGIQKPTRRQKKIVEAAVEVSSKSAWEEGEIGYLSPIFIQCTLPHSSPKNADGTLMTRYSRSNGSSTLFIETPDAYPLPDGGVINIGGIPFGTIPRMVLLDFATAVKSTGEPFVNVGKGISNYIRENLQMKVTGGKRGTITQVKEQLTRLAHSTFTVLYTPPETGDLRLRGNIKKGYAFEKISIAKRGAFFEPSGGEWKSIIEFSEGFFELLRETPVPLDLRVVHALRQNLFALDIYCWLAHRLFYLKKPTRIPWQSLKEQFGSSYLETRVFRFHFRKALLKALEFYRDAKVEDIGTHLVLYPSPSAVSDKKMLDPY